MAVKLGILPGEESKSVIPQNLGILSSSGSALQIRRRPSNFTLNTLSSSSSVHQTNRFKISTP
jgi:hypothetical protein